MDDIDLDALVSAMVQEDPDMVAAMLERSATDMRFLDTALPTLITLDGRLAPAAARVLQARGA